jgi:hypothetical protein
VLRGLPLFTALLFAVACGGAGGTETITVASQPETVTETETVTVTETAATPTSRPGRGIKINYGEWDGLFDIRKSKLTTVYGSPGVVAQFVYLGGGDCKLGYVEVDGTFFDKKGNIIGTGIWNDEHFPENAGLPMQIYADAEGGPPASAELVVTDASCV